METAIIVVLISSLGGLIGNVLMWSLNRKASKEDKKVSTDSEQSTRLDAIESKIDQLTDAMNNLGEKFNDQVERIDTCVEGLAWTVDGLEKANILNGHGKKYLEKLNKQQLQKGLEAMKFESFSKPSSNKRSK